MNTALCAFVHPRLTSAATASAVFTPIVVSAPGHGSGMAPGSTLGSCLFDSSKNPYLYTEGDPSVHSVDESVGVKGWNRTNTLSIYSLHTYTHTHLYDIEVFDPTAGPPPTHAAAALIQRAYRASRARA